MEAISAGVVLGQTKYGSAEASDPADPTTPQPGDYDFAFIVWRPASDQSSNWQFRIRARDNLGTSHDVAYSLSIDVARGTAVVATGPVLDDVEFVASQPVFTYIERAAIERDGCLAVQGWAVSLRPMSSVQVFLNGERIHEAAYGKARPDVAGLLPGYPNAAQSGFWLSATPESPAKTGARIRVQAVSDDGSAHWMEVAAELLGQGGARTDPALLSSTGTSELANPPAVGRRDTWLFCDDAELTLSGDFRVGGWAVCAIGIASVSVALGDRTLGEAKFGLPRHDVGDEYLTIPMARHSGFALSTRLEDVTAGEHILTVTARNALGDEKSISRIIASPTIPPGHLVRPETPVGAPEFRLQIDGPQLVDDVVIEPVTGRMTIEGWALARSGITSIEVLLNGQRVGSANHGLARQDVAQAFPDWRDSVRSGFAFHMPPRLLRGGEHVATLRIQAAGGATLSRSFRFSARRQDDQTALAIRRTMPRVEKDSCLLTLDQLGQRPEFVLVMRLQQAIIPAQLEATLTSLRNQVLQNWKLLALAEDKAGAEVATNTLHRLAEDLQDRLEIHDCSRSKPPQYWPGRHSGSDRRLYVFLSPGDELGCDALIEFALSRASAPGADLHYADESRISPVSGDREAFFKPDFSPDLLFSTNYIGRPWVASSDLLHGVGFGPATLLDRGEYDLLLRCTELAKDIRHIPKLLCSRGAELIDAPEQERSALQEAANRQHAGSIVLEGCVPGIWRLRRSVGDVGKVSIVIPTCAANQRIRTCLTTLRECTGYRNFEIICIENIPESEAQTKAWLRSNADLVLGAGPVFNWSQSNNRAADHAKGEFLLFLNDDVEVIDPDWLEAMLEHAQRAEVGIVGAQLLYPDRSVQHAGMFLAGQGLARHAFRYIAESDPGYFGLARTQRNTIAVTGACMMIRRDVFLALGRFNEAHRVINNDVGLCLRAHRAGLHTVYTPYARLVHHELASRELLGEVYDAGLFEQRWRTLFAAGDPYHNPGLSRDHDDCRPDDEPVRVIHAGHPLFDADEIRQILAVKLDHIGDFVTALPAIRRLKQLFPRARMALLCGHALRDFAEAEGCFDECIEFDFFHARSGLGKAELREEDYQLLEERLGPLRIDLTVDFRKQPDTRDVLRRLPTRLRAGFDYMGQFPFLDIALEWESDKALHHKRSHVSDDLLNLVEAIATAARPRRASMIVSGEAAAIAAAIPPSIKPLFEKPVVAVHPGVGNEMRQWPAEHFSALIDLLIERDAVNVMIIGGPDEIELADAVVESTNNRACVASIAGCTRLKDLPVLLKACALFIGNNSGPQHIAAAAGIPTIGIHSGVVDSAEWAPVGEQAVALRRAMTCSPCYLARREDCARELACLRGLEPAAVAHIAARFLAGAQARVASPATTNTAIGAEQKAVPRRANRIRTGKSQANA